MKDNYFTLYWLNGDRSIISGDTIERAFTTASYGADAVKALDWYDEGITETHYYDKSRKEWVKFEPIYIHAKDIKSFSEATLAEMFHKHHSVIVQFESKDQLRLEQSIGWTKHLSIFYGEWFKGEYDDVEQEDAHHFMAVGGQYFKPTDLIKAIGVLMSRSTSQHPYHPVGESNRLEDIKAVNPEAL